MKDGSRRTARRLRVIRETETQEPSTGQPQPDAMQALLLAQHGYQAAGEAADGATVPSLDDFVD